MHLTMNYPRAVLHYKKATGVNQKLFYAPLAVIDLMRGWGGGGETYVVTQCCVIQK